jgi:hypothetical protein
MTIQYTNSKFQAGPSGRVGLRPLACWDWGGGVRIPPGTWLSVFKLLFLISRFAKEEGIFLLFLLFKLLDA